MPYELRSTKCRARARCERMGLLCGEQKKKPGSRAERKPGSVIAFWVKASMTQLKSNLAFTQKQVVVA